MSDCSLDSVDNLSIQNAKNAILNALVELQEDEVQAITDWISTKTSAEDLEKLVKMKKDLSKLEKISSKLAKIIPPSGVLPSEKIELPNGVNADCAEDVTIHIDEFIYDDKAVDDMVDKGKISRHYCSNCKSHKIKELKIISHSFSRNRLAYVFNYLLPRDLSSCQLLDIGSRIGAVLYGGYYLSNFRSIIGVEISEDLCKIQNKIIDSCKLDMNRIRIINSDILNQSDIIRTSDYIIMNNVFEFFTEVEKQKEIWLFLKNTIKEDTFLISVPSITEILENLGIIEDFIDWLEPMKPFQYENEVLFDISDEEFSEIYFYKVQRN